MPRLPPSSSTPPLPKVTLDEDAAAGLRAESAALKSPPALPMLLAEPRTCWSNKAEKLVADLVGVRPPEGEAGTRGVGFALAGGRCCGVVDLRVGDVGGRTRLSGLDWARDLDSGVRGEEGPAEPAPKTLRAGDG